MQNTQFSKKFPPLNRKELGLGVLDIQLEGADGIVTLDPNGLAHACCLRKLPLTAPKFSSFFTGEPGYLYRTSDGVEFAVTEDQLYRLVLRGLTPEEVRKLHAHFGTFFETHDDFYDEDSGLALQSRMQD